MELGRSDTKMQIDWENIVLKINRKANGTIYRYKSRLVAKGYIQTEVINYEKTFSLIMRFASVHHILAIIIDM